MFLDILDDYKQLRENMELLIETQGSDEINKHALFFLSNIDNLKNKIENFENNNEKCKEIRQKIIDMF